MPTFVNTIRPTNFGFFDADAAFQVEADQMITFVKRRLGDDVISVELTSRQIWGAFEEACLEYSRMIHESRIKSELVNMLGLPTGSTDLTNKYPRATLEFLMRQAEPYASAIGVGGSYDSTLGYFELQAGRQDYNLYTELKHSVSGTNVYSSVPSGSQSKLRIIEVFHFDPIAAQSFLLNASNLTNFLASNFNYESYVNSTVFYVLPIFEDVLRRGMMEAAMRVRRSNYSYQIIGSNLRIFPIPSTTKLELAANRLYVRVYAGFQNPINPTAYNDDTIYGVSGPQNVPYGNLMYSTITQPGRQWIRQFTIAICKEILGQTRSKLPMIPIVGNDMRLNGPELLQQAQAEREKLMTDYKEFLSELTTAKLIEAQANQAELLNKQLRYVPFKKSVWIG
jgi:hypothetical protein